MREDWASTGATDLYSRARAKAIEILESHHPEPLPADVAAEIRGIVVETERELRHHRLRGAGPAPHLEPGRGDDRGPHAHGRRVRRRPDAG